MSSCPLILFAVREIPYHVSVMTQNVAGCGVKKEIDCFSREGGI